jgi:V8-like Glu-specific endopeptidase
MKQLILALLLCNTTMATTLFTKAVHGIDNRHEAYTYPDKQVRMYAHAVAAKVKKSSLHRSIFHKGTYSFRKRSLKNTYNFCHPQKFENQTALAGCTGFLVTPTTLITAGHCMKRKNDCKNNYWVFDVVKGTKRIKAENIYRCKKVIAQHFDENKNLDDYAIIELDRIVQNRTPLQVDLSGELEEDSSVYMIGHPIRLPLKVTDNAQIKNIYSRYFTTNLDVFSGNSGSPVFDSKTGKVIGLAVRAIHGYKSERSCYKLVTLDQERDDNIILKLGEIDDIRNFFSSTDQE